MAKATVVLEFRSQAQKERFIGGLLDGWGESAPIDVTWDCGKSDAEGMCEVPAGKAAVLLIRVFKED